MGGRPGGRFTGIVSTLTAISILSSTARQGLWIVDGRLVLVRRVLNALVGHLIGTRDATVEHEQRDHSECDDPNYESIPPLFRPAKFTESV